MKPTSRPLEESAASPTLTVLPVVGKGVELANVREHKENVRLVCKDAKKGAAADAAPCFSPVNVLEEGL